MYKTHMVSGGQADIMESEINRWLEYNADVEVVSVSCYMRSASRTEYEQHFGVICYKVPVELRGT